MSCDDDDDDDGGGMVSTSTTPNSADLMVKSVTLINMVSEPVLCCSSSTTCTQTVLNIVFYSQLRQSNLHLSHLNLKTRCKMIVDGSS